jgi:steroid delta-isomerase-like uncharacterized protein
MKRFITATLGLALLALVLTTEGNAQEPKLVAKIKQFDAAWNAQNFDGAMAFFADDATMKLMPPPPDGGVYSGKQQIGDFMKGLLPGFHVESIHFRQEGNTVKWLFTVHSDYFGQMGVNPVTGEATAVFEKEKIKSFTPVFDNATSGKMVARGFFDAFDKGIALDAMGEQFLAPDFVFRGPSMPPMDVAAYKQFGASFRTGFPDLVHTIEDQIAEGEKVVTRVTVTGTNKGEFQGMPATGKQVKITGIAIDRVVNGKIKERWVEFDVMGLMQQLGAIPMPGQKSN